MRAVKSSPVALSDTPGLDLGDPGGKVSQTTKDRTAASEPWQRVCARCCVNEPGGGEYDRWSDLMDTWTIEDDVMGCLS